MLIGGLDCLMGFKVTFQIVFSCKTLTAKFTNISSVNVNSFIGLIFFKIAINF